jgi:hypothetical protein
VRSVDQLVKGALQHEEVPAHRRACTQPAPVMHQSPGTIEIAHPQPIRLNACDARECRDTGQQLCGGKNLRASACADLRFRACLDLWAKSQSLLKAAQTWLSFQRRSKDASPSDEHGIRNSCSIQHSGGRVGGSRLEGVQQIAPKDLGPQP